MGDNKQVAIRLVYVGDRVAFTPSHGATEYGTVFRINNGARSTTVSIKTDDDKTYVRDISCVRVIADTRGDADYSVNHVS